MDSREAMRLACAGAGVKTIAESMGLSQTALYNQINDPSRQNLLQKFVDFTSACEDDTPMRWAAEQLNGIFIKNPPIQVTAHSSDAGKCVSDALREFSEVIKEISAALEDGVVTPTEAARIRKEWEDLKILLETFVLSCEFGFVKTQS